MLFIVYLILLSKFHEELSTHNESIETNSRISEKKLKIFFSFTKINFISNQTFILY